MRNLLKLQALLGQVQRLDPDLAIGPLSALAAVASDPGISVNRLAEAIGCPQQTASRYVANLSGRYQNPIDPPSVPLIRQEMADDDPRRRALYITAAGEKTLVTLIQAGWPN